MQRVVCRAGGLSIVRAACMRGRLNIGTTPHSRVGYEATAIVEVARPTGATTMANQSNDTRRGKPRGSRAPYSAPSEGQPTATRLHDIAPRDGGESLEDHQRDRSSRGTADH